MNGTRWAIRPAMKATSRESRSQLGDERGHLAWRCELRAPIERVRALSGLGFDEFRDEGAVLGFGEALDGGPLRLDPEARALLSPCGDTTVATARSIQRTYHRLLFG